jgi:phosphoribosyl 1,2-cyclic phosphate phosphodiesterase
MAPTGEIEITFLGTGTSHGVPMIGCDCEVCRSEDPRDRRHRASIALRSPEGRVLLIDTAPELRLSAVATGLDRVDAICYTHAHADHIMGLDDVRRFNDLVGSTIPAYGRPEALAVLRRAFGYAEGEYEATPDHRPSVRYEPFEAPRDICGLHVVPVPLMHGREVISGYRVGGFAYCTDCSAIPDESVPLLADLDLLVIDALRPTPHPAHFSLPEALEAIARLGPRRALLTHITHHLPHERTGRDLPPGVEMAYDGLVVTAPAGTGDRRPARGER